MHERPHECMRVYACDVGTTSAHRECRYFVGANLLRKQHPPSLETINTSSTTFIHKLNSYILNHDI